MRVLTDAGALARAAAEIFTASALQAVSSGGTFTAALSGGSTPRGLFRLLASRRYRDKIPWSSVHLFWADERCVPPTDELSNYRAADELLLGKVDIPEGNVHRIRGELGPEAGAKRYEEELRAHFGAGVFGAGAFPSFGLILLGMGADGHTASLFPGTNAVREYTMFAAPVTGPDVAPPRVTLTLPVINNAAIVVFMVSGHEKSETLAEVTGGGSSLPAGLVTPRKGKLIWLLDTEAARALNGEPS